MNTMDEKRTLKWVDSTYLIMKTFFTPVFVLLSSSLLAQFGGSYTYAYLNLPPSARIAALSGLNITTYDDDVNFTFQNPALFNQEMDGKLSVSNAFLPAGISNGSVAYARYFDGIKLTMGGGLLFRRYGVFEMTDDNGDRLGSFKAGEYAMQWGAAYGENKLRYGANAKLL